MSGKERYISRNCKTCNHFHPTSSNHGFPCRLKPAGFPDLFEDGKAVCSMKNKPYVEEEAVTAEKRGKKGGRQ